MQKNRTFFFWFYVRLLLSKMDVSTPTTPKATKKSNRGAPRVKKNRQRTSLVKQIAKAKTTLETLESKLSAMDEEPNNTEPKGAEP